MCLAWNSSSWGTRAANRRTTPGHPSLLPHPGLRRAGQAAYAAWDALEKESGNRSFCGRRLDLGPRTSAIPSRATARACGPAASRSSSSTPPDHAPLAAVRLPDDIQGLYQEQSGIAKAARANAAPSADGAGARRYPPGPSPVTGIRCARGEVDVEAGDRTYRCHRLVIRRRPLSNGALAHFGLELPLEVTQEQVDLFREPTQARFPA